MPQEESEPRTLTPFKVINRGEDTVIDDAVVFADFSPRVVPASVADEEIDDILLPKDVSALAHVVPPELIPLTEPTLSTTPVPLPVVSEETKSESIETTLQSSSIDPKTGPDSQPA